MLTLPVGLYRTIESGHSSLKVFEFYFLLFKAIESPLSSLFGRMQRNEWIWKIKGGNQLAKMQLESGF